MSLDPSITAHLHDLFARQRFQSRPCPSARRPDQFRPTAPAAATISSRGAKHWRRRSFRIFASRSPGEVHPTLEETDTPSRGLSRGLDGAEANLPEPFCWPARAAAALRAQGGSLDPGALQLSLQPGRGPADRRHRRRQLRHPQAVGEDSRVARFLADLAREVFDECEVAVVEDTDQPRRCSSCRSITSSSPARPALAGWSWPPPPASRQRDARVGWKVPGDRRSQCRSRGGRPGHRLGTAAGHRPCLAPIPRLGSGRSAATSTDHLSRRVAAFGATEEARQQALTCARHRHPQPGSPQAPGQTDGGRGPRRDRRSSIPKHSTSPRPCFPG